MLRTSPSGQPLFHLFFALSVPRVHVSNFDFTSFLMRGQYDDGTKMWNWPKESAPTQPHTLRSPKRKGWPWKQPWTVAVAAPMVTSLTKKPLAVRPAMKEEPTRRHRPRIPLPHRSAQMSPMLSGMTRHDLDRLASQAVMSSAGGADGGPQLGRTVQAPPHEVKGAPGGVEEM